MDSPLLSLPDEILQIIINHVFPLKSDGRPATESWPRQHATNKGHFHGYGLVASCRKLYALASEPAYQKVEWILPHFPEEARFWSTPKRTESEGIVGLVDLLNDIPTAYTRHMCFVTGLAVQMKHFLRLLTFEPRDHCWEINMDSLKLSVFWNGTGIIPPCPEWMVLSIISRDVDEHLNCFEPWTMRCSVGEAQTMIRDDQAYLDIAERVLDETISGIVIREIGRKDSHRNIDEATIRRSITWTRETKRKIVVKFNRNQTLSLVNDTTYANHSSQLLSILERKKQNVLRILAAEFP